MSMRIGITIYLILLALHIGLVWLLPYFPTQDGPSHLYNLMILRDLLNGGKEWGAYFTQQLHPVPNLAFEAISYPLMGIFSPFVVEKIFVSLYIVLMGSGIPLFLRTFGRSPLPLAFLLFPLLFNFTLMMGFYSYVMAIPLFLFGSSLSWRYRDSHELKKFVIFNLTGIIIFYSHLIPFIYYILFLLAMTVAEFTGIKQLIGKTAKLSMTLSPSLTCLLLYILATHGDTTTSKVVWATLDYLFADLCFFSTVTFSRFQLLSAYPLLALVIIGSYMSLKDFISSGWRITENARERRTLLIFAAMLVLIYFLMPFRFAGGSYFNERFPWVILLAGLPLLFLPETLTRKKLISFAGIIISLISLSCNTVIFIQQSGIVSEYLRGLQLELPRNTLGMGYKTKDNEWSRIDVLTHAASYYGIYKGIVDIGNYEARLPYFPVQFRKALPPLPPKNQIYFYPDKINWPLYPCIGYLFGWDLDRVERERLGRDFHIIREERRLTVWQRN